jgi:hypothetical protein
MRGELDDALARLRRWNEVRERLDERAGRTPDPGRDGARDEPEPGTLPISPAASGTVSSPPAAAPYARLTSPAAPSVPLPVIPAPARPSPTGPSARAASKPTSPAAAGTSPAPTGSITAPAPGEPRSPAVVEEVLEAIGEIVLRHRQLAVTVTVDDSGTAWTAHLVFGEDGGLSITRMEPRTFSTLSGGPRPARLAPSASSSAPSSPAPSSLAPSSPAPSSASSSPSPGSPSSPPPDDPEASERTASRLAELIRRDPSLLDPPRDLPR